MGDRRSQHGVDSRSQADEEGEVYEPKDGHTPIQLELLDTKRKTITEFHKGKTDVKEDDWRSGEVPASKST